MSPQSIAADAVRRVLGGRSLTPTLDELLARHPALSAGERGAVWDLSHGTLRHLGRIEAVLAGMLRKPVAEAGLHALLCVALYQLAYTRTPAYAIVSRAVDACVASGWPWAKAMVNAVLRRFDRERDALMQAACADAQGRYSYPQWWIERVRRDFPQDAEAVLEGGNLRPVTSLRVNARRWNLQTCLDRLHAEGFEARGVGDAAVIVDRIVPVARLAGFAEGCVSIQDAGAQRAVRFLELARGQRVLDACAAPGGKAAHILESEDVDLLALDSDSARLARVEQNMRRLGLQCRTRCADAAAFEAWWDGIPFDRVLADVPCTGSGVVRRHPDIKWLRREDDIGKLAAQARVILNSLWRVLAPGGKLLFVTCSVFQEENRAQIDDFVGCHADARIVPLPGVDAEDLQLLPDASHDGFYFALLERSR